MKNLSLVALMFVMGLVVASCHKVTGGGFIEGKNSPKAHFGFTFECDPETDDVWGQLTYHDGELRIKGKILSASLLFGCAEEGLPVGLFYGSFRTQPNGWRRILRGLR